MASQISSQIVLTFNGQNDYIDFGKTDLGGVFAQGSSTFTVSGWINPHQLTSQMTTYGTRNVFLARSSDRYSDNFEFGISESGNLDIFIDETVQKQVSSFGNGELTIDQWHFFAIVFDQGQLVIYLDEQRYSGQFSGQSLNKATSPLTLGGTLHNKRYFAGQLAHLSVWNYACLSVEIQRHRDRSLIGDEPGLVAYWPLNEATGKRIIDRTGHGYDGTVRGHPTWQTAHLPFSTTTATVLEMTLPSDLSDRTDNQPPRNSSPVDSSPVDSASTDSLSDSSPVDSSPVDSSSTDSLSDSSPVDSASTESSDPSVVPDRALMPMHANPNPKYKILAIDGGGIRGLIPTLILAEIEKRTQKPIFSLFDLIVGSSSGGVLALGLTKPGPLAGSEDKPTAQYSANELLQLYLEYGTDIFYEPFWEQVLGTIEDMFIQPKYSSKGREEVIKQYFGDSLLEHNLTEVFVTSYDIEQRIPVFFTNKVEKQQITSKRFRKLCSGFTLADAALATSATPTYFAPHRVATSHNSNGFYTLIDGGVVANNPAHMAVLEAQISRQEQPPLAIEDILLVSLGTGSLTSIYDYDVVKNWGLLQWSRPLFNIVLDGGSEVVAAELERWFAVSQAAESRSYYRFQPFLKSELEAIDNTRPENLRQLRTLANTLIHDRSQDIDALCQMLVG